MNSEADGSLGRVTTDLTKLLGVPDRVARKNALDYYQNIYLSKGKIGGMQAAYFSVECAPDKAMDEHLVDSTMGGALGSARG